MNIYSLSPEDLELFETLKTTAVDESILEPLMLVGPSQSRPGEQNGMYGYKWGDNHPRGMLGKTHSDETKRNWSVSRKGSVPWNVGIKSPKHSKFMRNKMLGNNHAKGIKYPRCSCVLCKKEVSANTINRHCLSHN